MNPDTLRQENEHLKQQNARLLSALEEIRSKLTEPEEVIRAIRQGEIDALVVEEKGREEIYSLLQYDSIYRGLVEESLPYGVWLAEPDGKLVYVSRSFLELVRTDLAALREKGQFHFLPPETREKAERDWKRSRETGVACNIEYTVRRDDGSERAIWTHGILIRTPEGLPYWVGINLDVTEQKKLKDELRQQAEELRQADRRKDEFLAILAHELRNPLAPLRNGLQVMKLARNNAEAVEQARSMMERQLAQMVRLIDDLLDMSRFSQGKIELKKERVELAKVVQQAVETSRSLIEAGGHELTVDMPPGPIYVDADVIRLAQVFANLLNNAAKYTDRGGQITLTVEQQDGEAVVSVRDTGVGIPAHMLPKVFEMFTQVDRSLERSQGGLGIGLSLVKGLVEMHGGTVEAHSEGHGMGSEFVVRLPVVLSLTGRARDESGEGAAASSRRRILVVDDNRDAAISLAMLLRLMGNEAHTAHDGQEALEAASALKPDVILLDLGMPKMNGYEVARRIRQQPWGKHVALVAVTGWGQQEDRLRSQEAGFSFHVVKPVEPAALEKLLAGLQATTG